MGLMAILRPFSRMPALSRPSALLLALAFIVATGAIDYFAGDDVDVALFYLFPVLLATWYLGPVGGMLCGVLCAIAATMVIRPAGQTTAQPASALWNLAVWVLFYGMVIPAAVWLRGLLERERGLARRDPLTGVANRREFAGLAARDLARCTRYARPIAVAYFDCENLTAVNDALGPPAGDRLLRAVAAVLQVQSRATDVVARLSGGEFALLLPDTDQAAARQLVVRMMAQLEETMERQESQLTCYVTVVSFSQPPDSMEALMSRADGLFYELRTGQPEGVKGPRG